MLRQKTWSKSWRLQTASSLRIWKSMLWAWSLEISLKSVHFNILFYELSIIFHSWILFNMVSIRLRDSLDWEHWTKNSCLKYWTHWQMMWEGVRDFAEISPVPVYKVNPRRSESEMLRRLHDVAWAVFCPGWTRPEEISKKQYRRIRN
jgi:hypothetical protein